MAPRVAMTRKNVTNGGVAQPGTLRLFGPTGLVDVLNRLILDVTLCGLHGCGQRRTHLVFLGGDAAQTEVRVENRLQNLFHVAVTDAHPARQVAHRRLHPGTKTPRRHPGRKLGGGPGATHQTPQRVLAVLGHFRFDPRQVGYLTPHRLSVLTQQQRPALVTRRRLQVNHVLHLFDGNQFPPMSEVAHLPTGLTPRRSTLGTGPGTRPI